MIVKNVCLLLEALSIVICLHHLYGEKFRLDIATISFLSIDMIITTAINYFGLSKTYTMIIYPIIVLYCGVRFGFQVKKLAVNIVLCIILLGVIQLGVVFVFNYFWDTTLFTEFRLIFISSVSLLIFIFILPLCKIGKLAFNINDRGKLFTVTISICILMVLFLLISFKELREIALEPVILLFVCFLFILILSRLLIKYKIKAKEIETELKMQKLYADSFQGLIDNIRLKQHEFDNHMNAIYSLHYTYCTYEKLVNAQKDYCKLVTEENRFNKLLSAGNSIVIGFLYGQFMDISKKGIDITYQVNIKELDVGIPSYKIVEMLGDLLNNAVEALLMDGKKNGLHISVVEVDYFYAEVRNESSYIDYQELGLFFSRDYSKKGKNRGLGLYNVKLICEKYGLDISCKNIEIDGKNWLSFELWKGKETI